MKQENDKKRRKFMHSIANSIIWIVALVAAGCLFLSFRHANMAKEVQGSRVEIVARAVDEENIQDDDTAEYMADTYNYTGYTDISLQMDNGTATQRIKMYMKYDKCYFFLPACASFYKFTIQYQEDCYEIKINDKPVASGEQIAYGEIAKQQSLTIAVHDVNAAEEGEQGDFVPYSLSFMQSENLPVIFVETVNGTMEYIHQAKTNKEAGEMVCILPDGSIDSMGNFTIHARGTSSFEITQKKQYKIDLEEAVDILSMGKGCKWVLQANALDSTQIRNNIAYEFARNLKMHYAVDSAYADVYFNGEYGGNYLLCEPVELGENRIAIDEEGSYLLAIDRVAPGDDSFTDQYGLTFTIKYPEENTSEEIEWLKTHINSIENFIDTCDTWEKYQKLQEYIDIDSFVNMYLMDAITNETDANSASCYYYIDGKDGKLYAGPAWDYDRAWGNSKNRGSYRFNVYFNGLPEQLAMIPYFMQDIQNKLQNSQKALLQLKEGVETMSNEIRASVDMEEVIYGDTESGFVETGDYDTEIAFLKYYIEKRVDWISDIIFHPDTYHRVFINSDKVGLTYWVENGETIPAADLDYIYGVHNCESLLFENGSAFWDGYPVLEDIVLYGYVTEGTADETIETGREEPVGGNVKTVAEADKETYGMGLLSFIIILAPGFIVLFISTDWNVEKNMSKAGLLVRYFCYDFLILLFTYGSIYSVKGAITLSLSGAADSAFDYTIYNVNVVFLLMILELAGACVIGGGIRISRKVIRKRNL